MDEPNAEMPSHDLWLIMCWQNYATCDLCWYSILRKHKDLKNVHSPDGSTIQLGISLSLSLSCGLQGSIRLTLPTGSDLWTPHYAAVPRPTLANFGGETHGSYLECWGCTQSTEGCPDLPSYGAWHFSYEHMKNPCPMGFVQVLTMVQ